MSFINDLVTLDVITVTGDLSVQTRKKTDGASDDPQEEFVIDFRTLFGRKDGKTTVRGDLKVVAATHIEVDRDSLTFIGDNLSDRQMELVEMHMKTVATSLEARAAIVARLSPGRLVGDIVGRIGGND